MKHEEIILLVVIVGLVLLVVAVLIVIQSMNRGPYEKVVGLQVYSTKKARRIFGLSGESVHNSQFTGWMQSIWLTFDGHFFILSINELDSPKIHPLTMDEARQFISKHAEEQHAQILFKEWFS